MKPQDAPICLRNPLEQQLGPIVARLWMLPRDGAALGSRVGEPPFSPELALRQLQALEAELDASLSPARSADDSFVLLH